MEAIEYDEWNDAEDSDFLEELTESGTRDEFDSQIEASYNVCLGL